MIGFKMEALTPSAFSWALQNYIACIMKLYQHHQHESVLQSKLDWK